MSYKIIHYKSSLVRQILRRLILPLVILAIASPAAVMASADPNTGVLLGTVSAVGANAQTYNIPGASLKLRGTTPGLTPMSVVSNDR